MHTSRYRQEWPGPGQGSLGVGEHPYQDQCWLQIWMNATSIWICSTQLCDTRTGSLVYQHSTGGGRALLPPPPRSGVKACSPTWACSRAAAITASTSPVSYVQECLGHLPLGITSHRVFIIENMILMQYLLTFNDEKSETIIIKF